MTTTPRRRQPATREAQARALFRAAGFRVESVSFIRGHNDEFMAIHCYPATDAAAAVTLLTDPRNDTLDVTRIHLGTEKYGPPVARVYVRFTHQPEPTMTWDDIEAAIGRLEHHNQPAHDERCENKPGGQYAGKTLGGRRIPCHCQARADGRAQAERELARDRRHHS